jgi:hypothetical protein
MLGSFLEIGMLSEFHIVEGLLVIWLVFLGRGLVG